MHGFPPRSAAARRRPRFPPGEWATDASSSFATNGHESWQLKLYIAMFGGSRLLQSASPVPCLARCPSKRCARCRNGVAARVIQQAFDDGVARMTKIRRESAEAYVQAKFWRAGYLPFIRAVDI